MDVKYPYNEIKKIKIFLVFFCYIVLLACHSDKRAVTATVIYKNGKAIGVSFPNWGNEKDLKVVLVGNSGIPVMGEFTSRQDQVTFTPITPFSNNHEYQVFRKERAIARFKVKPTSVASPPELVALYPNRDTVPVNLLKLYLVFSKPMQFTGSSLDFITVYDETENSEVQPFLKLESELWSEDQTCLTLWLDPGRIKTDLIPNKEKGLPLKENHRYKLTLSHNWRSSQGIPMARSYTKQFYVMGHDGQMPNPKNWRVIPPREQTTNPLKIDFMEAMDAVLALESLVIFKGKQRVAGNFKLIKNDEGIEFYPALGWTKGNYVIAINPVFEDLAGNNLQHLFDTDLKNQAQSKTSIETTLHFDIK